MQTNTEKAPSPMGEEDETSANPSRLSHPHAHFDLEAGLPTADGQVNNATDHIHIGPNDRPQSMHSEHDPSKRSISPHIKRRATRSATVKSFKTTQSAGPLRPSWGPGQEPGLDPSKPNGGRTSSPMLHEECQITVVDYSEKYMEMHDFDNAGLIEFIQQEQEPWIKTRWINVNGISWDVIQSLGKQYNLHRLAIEDLINTDNRTKVDWYITI